MRVFLAKHVGAELYDLYAQMRRRVRRRLAEESRPVLPEPDNEGVAERCPGAARQQ